MRRAVEVHLRSIHRLDGEEAVTLTQAQGQYHHSPRMRLLFFREHRTQEDEQVDHKLVIEQDGVRLERFYPGYHTQLGFYPGRRQESLYRTPFGEIPMEIETETVSVQEDEQQLVIELKYRLYTQGQLLGEYEMKIESRFC
ncbi:MAG: DUF1934 domain-containing protein [Eubacteriales bacterium]|nr:DUF1934 domain-containing protein [Eubacteriales bacterium]